MEINKDLPSQLPVIPLIIDPGLSYAGIFKDLNSDKPAIKEALLIMAALSTKKRLKILMADDDPDDRDLFKEAVGEVKKNIEVSTVNDGDQLMKVLEQSENNLPDIIFLDINMPCKNGQECLREIKAHEKLKEIPVVIYSTSARFDLIDSTYEQGATLYVQKPDSYTGIKEIARKILSLNITDLKKKTIKSKFFISHPDNNL